ncbi:hypothetical protein BJ322DRAFT_1003536 [Thelephora terrestris]|uniref:Uncharacterized protein n=1 Tax=Thelephora terrestris TaxID=56493 RepID=A0A9P6HGB1_9AGAM|nr:hypothetical protein BJ322DRAFT_1003536 [Thelephora terrestris]
MPSAKAHVNTVTDADLEAFDPRRGKCCTASNFRFNLGGTAWDVWNKSATRVFVNHFLEKHTRYPANDKVVRSMVTEKTTSAIGSIIRSYRLRDTPRDDLKVSRKKRARRERKRTLFIRRRNLTRFYPGLMSQQKKLDQLGVSGMSSDETSDSGGTKQWRILAPQWRSDAVTAWVRYFDALYHRAKRDRRFGNDRGALPRVRKNAKNYSNNTKFVGDLPKNAYRPQWLNEQIDIVNTVRPGPNVSWMHEPAIVE